ncbi:TonB C-terminal domain-containing protein [Hyphomicrobium sp. CS1BSMeth3]|uniref:TonB C-terminal domain-containing protein n=1 Tax=Hyphomicrobium sp. CS1BSMeth3 TaxID=1892844 RepID=UPI000930EDDA|nr:TonB C-terminal domain-containing protein [Hyphomicrobium sp. CS1BSMeth3]
MNIRADMNRFALPEDEEPFLRRHGLAIGAGLGAVMTIGAVAVLLASADSGPPLKPAPEMTIVNIIPPPPPPPPPEERVVEQKPEPEMIEQPKVEEIEIKAEKEIEEPQEAPPEAVDDIPPTGPLGVDAAADGPGDRFNLAARPGARGFGGGGGGGSRWGWYASIVQQEIETAIRANPKTKNIVMQVQVRLWADATGRVNRVQLVSSTGDAEVDAAIRSEVLAGLTLRQPPPADMPMPMVARITARKST